MKKAFILIFLFFPILLMAQNWAVQGADLNKSVADTYVDSVWNGINLPDAYSGEGVIIGITDWGFDYTHPVFYDTSMTNYRILRAWDQYKTSGPAPEGFDYGTEFVGKDALLTAQCDTSNVYKYGYHGTHVAGIAAGAGAGTAYRGVAHGAHLLFATFLISEQAVIDAFDWMYNVAQQEGKRLVVNMSWGLYYMDNFTGTGRIGKKMEELTDLGVVFVTSAGNNGDVNFHLKHDFDTEADTLKSVFQFASGSPYQYGQCITMTNSEQKPFNFAIQVMNNSYSTLAISPFMSTANGDQQIDTFIVVGDDTLEFMADIIAENSDNHRPEVRLKVKKATSSYRFGLLVTAPSGIFHAWNVIELTNGVGNWGAPFIAPNNMPDWKAGDAEYGLGTPTSTDCVISVAAYQPRVVMPYATVGGAIADFSSFGPTIDERPKPEIAAPGKGIISSLSSFTTEYSGTYNKTITFQDKEYKFVSLSGTSMSSPFIAGVVALMLQANPYLSADQIKQILIETARQDNYTAQTTSAQFGAGKVNAHQAVLLALQTVGIEDFSPIKGEFTIYPNPSNGTLFLSAAPLSTTPFVEIFDITGKKIFQQKVVAGVNQFSLSTLRSGYYVIRIVDGEDIIVKKWIKN